MKVWAAAVVNNGGDHYVFVSLNKEGIREQILEMARNECDDRAYFEKYYADDYLDYDDYLVDQYLIQAHEEIDL
ncbi:hypothetical protein PBI_MRMAGOO_74 [Mycobacterium phage MrMagoo]|uniref:Uncharacterized protein n=1 Tax=Mycobacterium phage MrMagoo TaxID=1927020 RepID=A0A1L6BYK8_9CAUD|nr:hypothetical protein J4U04_gp074 [Mycobacterium phage MrMagoo]APQ42178.1 hypothetical protein PBI_MRMAGOO_74 [Mycobacterium phage MrMagoo]ARM70253.1 hypothetical protein SEA_GARDENSALSA_73 [Mycobacterium phage GardenSalsa]